MKKLPLTLFISTLFTSGLSLADTLIHAGKLIPANNDSVMTNVTIVVDGKKIKSVEKGFKQPGGDDTVIDLREHTVMPGLMDMHTHITFQNSGIQGYLERYSANEADYALKGVVYAEKTLMSGFTTIRNLGDGYNETVALRNAINSGKITGPRYLYLGKIHCHDRWSR